MFASQFKDNPLLILCYRWRGGHQTALVYVTARYFTLSRPGNSPGLNKTSRVKDGKRENDSFPAN